MVSNNGIVGKVLGLVVAVISNSLLAATAGFDVLVVDADTLTPIKGVDVVGWFSNDNGWKAWTESAPEYVDRNTTDDRGVCHVKGETNTGETGVNIRNPPKGYYPNYFAIRYWFTQKPLFPLAHWRPTDLVITARLQRIERPIPLLVKKAGRNMGSDAITKNGGIFAFDFFKSSFLPPFGEGEVADVVFSCPPQEYLGEGSNGRDRKAPRYKNTVMLTFKGDKANGLWRSPPADSQAFLRVREAPESGYQHEFSFAESTAQNILHKEGLDKKRDYCFRVRTVRNEKGEIVSAFYGKIYGDPSFLLDGSDRWRKKVGGIVFLYYLNPKPNDRNLEWDMKNNLCPNPGDIGIPKP